MLPPQRQIALHLQTTANVNPSGSGQALPVKLCVIELSRAGWSPPGLYEGQPCREVSTGSEVIRYTQYILPPSGKQQYRHTVPYDQERWLVIAAEFQNMGGARALIEQKSAAYSDFSADVVADNRALSILPISQREK